MTFGRLLKGFDRFQTSLEEGYEKVLKFTLRRPLSVLAFSFLLAWGSCSTSRYVPKTFLPPQDAGEFAVGLDMPPGTNLDGMEQVAQKAEDLIRTNPEVRLISKTIGGAKGKSETADFYVQLTPSKQRKLNTSQVKENIRQQLKPLAYANPQVKDYDAVGGGQRPFNLNIIGLDEKQLEEVGLRTTEFLKKHPAFKDVDTNFRPGKPELQVALDQSRAKALGISSKPLGQELRAQIEGLVPAKFRELGREYDIRVRLMDSQRDLKADFNKTYVPNINGKLIRLADVATPHDTTGPATINRQDRGRLFQISADMTPGQGMGQAIEDIDRYFANEGKIPLGMRYAFVGQAENFQELGESMAIAMGFGVLFIYLVLSSLYESFVMPFTIMLALPLAICGSLLALFIAHESLNIFSMIGVIMLLGIATKNSILLVDYAHQLIDQGMDRSAALIRAGKTRLRPIMMTTMALIAGTVPIALGLNEASRQRTSMGIAIIGGLISSTILTLVVVPAAFSFLDRFRLWSKAMLMKLVAVDSGENGKSDSHTRVAEKLAETVN